MSTALASFKIKETRPRQSEAGVGATLAHNEIITTILPPIVAELEGKINELQAKIDHILDEMKWHPNAISSGTAHPALQSAAATYRGGRKTRKQRV